MKQNKNAHIRAAGWLLPMFFLCAALFCGLLPQESALPVSGAPEDIFASGLPQSAARSGYSDRLIPLGRTTGIKLYSEGTMVVGFSDIGEEGSPAERGGLKTGDVIVALNGAAVTGNESLIERLSALTDARAAFTVLRDAAERTVTVQAVCKDETWRIGAWVRDSIAGIGTITFVDPQTGAFGALGHGVCDADTGALMPFGSGAVMASEVASVQRGACGKPGQLSGSFELYSDQGTLSCNTPHGIFGRLADDRLYAEREAVPVAERAEMETGAAVILSNVAGTETDAYDVEIVRVYGEGNEGRDLMLCVTDEELLSKTGGIVQGMSGSPILQNGKLIGAVTHVLVNDPTRGYGIYIGSMLSVDS